MPRLNAYQEYSQEFDHQIKEREDEIKEEEKLERERNDRREESLIEYEGVFTIEDMDKLKLPEIEFEKEDPEVVQAQ